MKRRRYLRTVGASASVAITLAAGCGSPGDGTGTETGTVVTDNETTSGDGTETATEGSDQTGTETEAGSGDEGGSSNVVQMVTDADQYYFDPIGLYVEPGTEVTWNNDSGSHSSTAYVEDNPQASVRRIPEGAEGWNSDTISEEGATFSHTFETAGTYDYYCIPHKTLEMVGRVVVGEPSGLDGDPPDGAVPAEQDVVDQGSVSFEAFQSG